MSALDLAAFRAIPLVRTPFEYLILPGFIKSAALTGIHADYPRVPRPGSFPLPEVQFGPAFGSLIDELQGNEMRTAFEEKFRLDLSDRPTMVTVRGRSCEKDGNIHTDALSKIITVLIYMNPAWESGGGRLRLLRSPTDMEDFFVEIPPTEGTLVAFRRSGNSYHGHKQFIGERRVIQLNWVTDAGTVRREIMRHRVSAWMKKLLPLKRAA